MSNYRYPPNPNFPYPPPPSSQPRQTPPAPQPQGMFPVDPYPQAPHVNYDRSSFGQRYNQQAYNPAQPPLPPQQQHGFPSHIHGYYQHDHPQMLSLRQMPVETHGMPNRRGIREPSIYYRQGPPMQASQPQGPPPPSHPSPTTSVDIYQQAPPAHMMQAQSSHQSYWSDYSDNASTAGAPPPGGGPPLSHTTQPPRPGPHRPAFDEQESRHAAYGAFDRFDLDKGGYLDLQEFMDALRTLNLSITYHDAIDRFFIADHNKDGRISREEFVDIYINEMKMALN